MFLDPHKDIEKHKGNLPHWQQGSTWIFVTWRLADSLPKSVVEKLLIEKMQWEESHPKPWSAEEQKEHNRLFTLRFESLLDEAHGSCFLRDPAISQIVAAAFHHFNGHRYQLDSYVVMPNHVHVLFQPLGEHPSADILHSWKRFTAREINQTLEQTGQLWQHESWDRLIRSYKHFAWARNYIERNPAKLSPGTYKLWQYGEGV
ncbi:transposase [Haloferula sp.]|uniref:transposase n=1 Tax=Haloferula sp. TaxID=2497595 RepID=UPI003C745CB5